MVSLLPLGFRLSIKQAQDQSAESSKRIFQDANWQRVTKRLEPRRAWQRRECRRKECRRFGRCRRIGNYFGREMPSFFILDWRVVRFMAKRAAAPLGPPSTQSVWRR